VIGFSKGRNQLLLGNGTGFRVANTAGLGSAQTSTYAVALGDLNGDGKLDLVVGETGNECDGTASTKLYVGGGDGTFAEDAGVVLGRSISITSAVALGDVNGDSFVDILVGNRHHCNGGEPDAATQLYLGDGSGGFIEVAGPSEYVSSMALGDINHDGYLDVLVGRSGRCNAVFLGDDAGNFTEDLSEGSAAVRRGNGVTLVVALADLDGDGDLDAVIGNDQSNQLLLGDGTGGFIDASSMLPDSQSAATPTTALALGDFAHDGLIDIFIGNNMDQSRLLLNRVGDGAFVRDSTSVAFVASDPQTQSCSSASIQTGSMVLGDVNGDGHLDLVTANSGDRVSEVLLGTGDGGFGAPTQPFAGLTQPLAVALADFDRDGALDALFGTREDHNNVLFLGAGDGTFDQQLDSEIVTSWNGRWNDYTNVAVTTWLPQTSAVAIGDINNDGWPDAVIGNNKGCRTFARDAANQVFLNDGAGHLIEVNATAITYSGGRMEENGGQGASLAKDMVLGDLNGDGFADLIIANLDVCNTAGSQQVFLGNGTGVFLEIGFVGAEWTTQALGLADVDGDGILDVVTCYNHDGNNVVLLVGVGNGTFAFHSIIHQGRTLPNALVIGDVNGDGSLDLIVGMEGANLLFFGDGAGGFRVVSNSAVTTDGLERTLSLVLGDLDNDGDLDFVEGTDGNVNKLFLFASCSAAGTARSPLATAASCALRLGPTGTARPTRALSAPRTGSSTSVARAATARPATSAHSARAAVERATRARRRKPASRPRARAVRPASTLASTAA